MAGPDVLPQSEIDDLLSALSTGVVSTEAMKLEKSRRRLKLMISNGLISFLKIRYVASVDRLTYEEFIGSLPNPSVITLRFSN